MLSAEDAAFKVFSNGDGEEVPEPLQTSSRIEVRSRHPEMRPYGGAGMESRDKIPNSVSKLVHVSGRNNKSSFNFRVVLVYK